MKNIILFATAWGSKFGGINSFNTSLSIALSKVLVDTKIICVVLEAEDEEKIHAQKNGIELFDVSASPDHNNFDTYRSKEVINILKAKGYESDILWIGHDVKTGELANHCAKEVENSRSVVIHHMNYQATCSLKHDNPQKTRERKSRQKQVLQNADIVCAVGPKLLTSAKDLVGEGRANDVVELIPGIDYAISPNTKPPNQFCIISFGRITEEDEIIKQLRLPVAAFAWAIKNHPAINDGKDPYITLYGCDDDMLNELRVLASRYVGQDIVHIEPHLFDESIGKKMLFEDLKNHSICIMPSYHEGFGLVAWESISTGIPIIMSKNSGAFQFLDSSFGKTISSSLLCIHFRGTYDQEALNDEDVKKLGQKIIDVYENINPEKDFALELRERLLQEGYTWEGMAIKFASACSLDCHILEGVNDTEEEPSCHHTLYKNFDTPPSKKIELRDVEDKTFIEDFFRGFSDNWIPVQAGISLERSLREIIERKQYETSTLRIDQFINSLLIADKCQFIKIFGAGGSGKTTIARQIAFKLARRKHCCLFRNLEKKLWLWDDIKQYASDLLGRGERLFLFYDDPSQETVSEIFSLLYNLNLSSMSNISVCVFDREDEWLEKVRICGGRTFRNERTLTIMEKLGKDEVDAFCNIIQRIESMGIDVLCSGQTLDRLRENLIKDPNKIILVAAYEATTGEKIEDILLHEFNHIPTSHARAVYKFLCGMSCYNINVPINMIRSIYGQDAFMELKNIYLKGIVFARNPYLLVRHKKLGEILWNQLNDNAEDEFSSIVEFLSQLEYTIKQPDFLDLTEFSKSFIHSLINDPKLCSHNGEILLNLLLSLSNYVDDFNTKSLLFSVLGRFCERRCTAKIAKKCYEQGIEKVPSSSLYNALGQLLEKSDEAEALKVYREGIQKAPGPSLYTALGQLLEKSDEAKALKVYREGIQKAPGPGVYTALGQLLEKSDEAEALKVKFRGIALYPYNFYLFNSIFACDDNFVTKRFEGLIKAVSINKLIHNRIFHKILLNLRKKGVLDVAEFINKYKKKIVEIDSSILVYAAMLESSGEIQQALAIIDNVQINNAEVENIKANCYKQQKKWGLSEENYKKAIEHCGNDITKGRYCNNLAMLIKEQDDPNRFDEGIVYCKQSIRYSGENFHYPKKLMVYFMIELSEMDSLQETIAYLRKTYGIGKGTFRNLLREGISSAEKAHFIKLHVLEQV